MKTIVMAMVNLVAAFALADWNWPTSGEVDIPSGVTAEIKESDI